MIERSLFVLPSSSFLCSLYKIPFLSFPSPLRPFSLYRCRSRRSQSFRRRICTPDPPTTAEIYNFPIIPLSTLNMMSYQPRRLQTSRKRKEIEAFFPSTLPKPLVQPTAVNRVVSGANQSTTSSKRAEQQQPLSSNRLLAGYMAYEFLTKGTLLGQKFDPARAEALPVSSTESKRNRLSQSQPCTEGEPSGKSKPQGYAEVANLLKSDGVHIPGVVNPTQLARWIQM